MCITKSYSTGNRGGRSPTTLFADTIEHTHIWATKYDDKNHWEYCTVCGEKRNVTAHTFTDHWYSNPYVCGGKASNRTCDCGYGYTYYPQHVKDPTVRSATGSVRVHYWTCKNCDAWMNHEDCRNQNGALNCKNPGTCSVCGGVWPVGKHYIKNGRCVDCGKQIYKKVNCTQIYSDDYSTVTYTFDIIPLVDNMEVIASTCFVQPSNHSSFKNNFVKNDDGSYTIQWIFTIDPTKATITAIPNWRYECVTVDGYKCYVLDDEFSPCWMDHTAPIISDIKQTDQNSYNEYATIKQLDISGTEDYANQITLSISDKANGKVMVDNAKIPVSNGNWKYTCTPPLEADESGRTYVVRIEDVNGNVSTKDFTIYKTDGTAPQVESPLSYTDWTNIAKTITLTFTDYGSGDVQASLGDQTSYKACTKTADGKYQITYTFSDDIIGNKTYKLYLRDGLGNVSDYDLVIGNIDKNTYNISYNLNGSSMSGQKTSYTVTDSFTLPTPTKTGYTFTGWTGSNGTTPQKTITINKGTRGNLSYTTNWQINMYRIDANGVLDDNGIGNIAGYATVDVYINGKLDAENATDYYKFQPYGTKYEIRYKANNGYVFIAGGNNGVYSGIVTDNISTYPVFRTKTLTTTFHRNRDVSDTVTAIQKYTYGVAGQKFSDNDFDYPGYILAGYDFNKNAENPTWSVNNGVAYYWIDNQYPANDVYAIWKPISWTVKYDANGGSGAMADTKHTYNAHIPISKNQFNKVGYTFDGWQASRIRDGKTEWLCGNIDNSWISGGEWYEKDKIPSNRKIFHWASYEQSTQTTYIDDDVITLHAQWQYNPVSVKVPQVLTGDHTGKSQFRVKCDDFKAGSIKVTVPNSFLYKQAGRTDVMATITAKSGHNVITSANKICTYDITTRNGLSAGCWSGSFNIGLTLTKE